MSKYRYVVLGAGAIGSFIGAKLYASGISVSFLCRSNFHALKAQGFEIEEAGRVSRFLDLHLYQDNTDMASCDVGLLCTKSFSNDELLTSLAKTNYPKIIVSLQNGIGLEDQILHYLPDVTVVTGSCWIKATVLSETKIRHDFGHELDMGQYDSSSRTYLQDTDIIANIRSDFLQSGLSIKSTDISSSLWTKLALNVPLCILSMTHNLSTTELTKDPERLKEFYQYLDEILRVASSQAVAINMSFIKEKLGSFSSAKNNVFHSMKIDFDAGLPIEMESMFLNLQKIARTAAIAIPLLDAAILHIQSLTLMKECEIRDKISAKALVQSHQFKLLKEDSCRDSTHEKTFK